MQLCNRISKCDKKIKDAQFEEKKDIRKLNVNFTASEEKDGFFF